MVVAVALGGALGAPARYGLAELVPAATGGFPWATFVTNVTGSFALGLVLALVLERFRSIRYLRPFVATGFLGAYTTYSTFAVEIDLLVRDGRGALALAYVAASLVAGLAAVGAGIWTGRALPLPLPLDLPLGWAAFVAVGAAGAVARYLVDGAVRRGTFVVNVTGSLALGLLTGLALYHGLSDSPRVVLGTGFCGTYTTFSTHTFETVRLIEDGAIGEAARTALGTLVAATGAAAVGLALAAAL